MKSLLLSLLLLILPAAAWAQCPGDPTSGNPATRQLILSLGATIPATASDAMLRMADALQAQGHAVSVMDNNGPSDHKAWIDGDAWTWRSSDAVRCPTITWSPYVQAAYDNSGFSACGIPNSARLGCPAWFTNRAPQPAPLPPAPIVLPPPPGVPPIINLDLSALILRLDAIQATNQESLAIEKDTNAQVAALNKSFAETIGQAATFIGKYIAPAVAAWIAAKKF